MDLISAGKKLCENFKNLRAKEQAKLIMDYDEFNRDSALRANLIVQPMVYFNMWMLDEFEHDFWGFLCLLKENPEFDAFNPYNTWFLWDKEKEILLSADSPYEFLPSCMNLLLKAKNHYFTDLVNIHTEEGAKIRSIIDSSSDEELTKAWEKIVEDAELW